MIVGLVEDEEVLADLVESLLNLEGISVRRIAPYDAIHPASWEGVTVAIVDLMLPDVGGRQVLEYLLEHFPHIHRITWSASVIGVVNLPEGLTEHAFYKGSDPIANFVDTIVGYAG